MKLFASKAAAFVENPDKNLRVFLLYGPDSGLVAERAALLAKKCVGDIQDPFAVVELTPATLAADPARLMDEMATIALFGGRRLVRVKEGDDGVCAALEAVLRQPPPGDSLCIIEAGDLGKKSKLRLRVEEEAAAMALPCYAEEGRDLSKTIAAMLQEQGFTAESAALERLTTRLPADRSGVRHEMDKLITYAMHRSPKRITLADVEACIQDGLESDVDEAVHAALLGDSTRLDSQLTRLAAEHVPPIHILRTSQRHLIRLYEALGLMQEHKLSAGEAVKRLRPPVFFKHEAAMQSQLGRWNSQSLSRALTLLLETERRSKTTSMPAELLSARALQGLSRMARR